MKTLSSMVLVLLVCSSLAAADAPGTASGSLTVDGKTVPLKYAMSRASKKNVMVLISDVAVPADDFKDRFAMMDYTDKHKISGVLLEIDPDKNVISGTIYSPQFTKFDGHISAAGMHKLDLSTFNGNDVAGKAYMDKEDEFFGSHYKYDATFHAVAGKLSAPAPAVVTGKPLPAGGGAPAKAYLAYDKALKAADWSAVKKMSVAERAKMMDDPEAKKMLPLLQAMQPKGIVISGGSIDGNTATLKATAKGSMGGDKQDGTITMMLEGGAWKVANESWEPHEKD